METLRVLLPSEVMQRRPGRRTCPVVAVSRPLLLLVMVFVSFLPLQNWSLLTNHHPQICTNQSAIWEPLDGPDPGREAGAWAVIGCDGSQVEYPRQ